MCLDGFEVFIQQVTPISLLTPLHFRCHHFELNPLPAQKQTMVFQDLNSLFMVFKVHEKMSKASCFHHHDDVHELQ